MTRFLSLWLPVGAYMGVIFYVSSLSHPPAPQDVSDKTLHFLAYAGLAVVALRATSGGRWSGVTRGTMVCAWSIAALYGVTDEWHQMSTPGRSPEWADVVADALGALAGVAAVKAWVIIRRL